MKSFRKWIALLLTIATALSGIPAWGLGPDSSTEQKIQNQISRLSELQKQLEQERTIYLKMNNSYYELGQRRLQASDAARGRISILFVSTLKNGLDAITTSWKELGINVLQEITDVDIQQYFSMNSTTTYASGVAQDVLALRVINRMMDVATDKAQSAQTRITIINQDITQTKAEIDRLKQQYKASTGEDFGSARTIGTSKLINQYNNNGARGPNNEPLYGTANAAAMAMWNKLRPYVKQNYTFTSPELTWTNNTGNVMVFRTLLIPPVWNGDYKSAYDRSSYESFGTSRQLITVFKTSDNQFFAQAEGAFTPYNTAPTVTLNLDSARMKMGQKSILKAQVNDAEGDACTIQWFYGKTPANSGFPVYQKIGEGDSFEWTAPNDPNGGSVSAVVYDAMGGFTVVTAGTSTFSNFSAGVISLNSVMPSQPVVGQPAIAQIKMLAFAPGTVTMKWRVHPTNIANTASGPDVSSGESDAVLSSIQQGDTPLYYYMGSVPFVPAAKDSTGVPVTAYAVHVSYSLSVGGQQKVASQEYAFDIPLDGSHIAAIKQEEQAQQSGGIAAFKSDYDKALAQFESDYTAYNSTFSADYLTNLYRTEVRTKEFIDWKLGQAAANEAWGTNYTASLFVTETTDMLKQLGTLATHLDVSGESQIQSIINNTAGDDGDVVILKKLTLIRQNGALIEKMFDRQDALGQSYQKLNAMYSKLSDMIRDAGAAAPFQMDTVRSTTYSSSISDSDQRKELQSLLAQIDGEIQRYPYSGSKTFNFPNQPIAIQPIVPITQSGSSTYSDVQSTDWFYPSVTKLTEMGILSADTTGIFNPKRPVTRGQFAMALAKALNLETARFDFLFSDVKLNDADAGAVEAVYRSQIMKGNGGGAFRPDDPITREQSAMIVGKAYEILGETTLPDNPALNLPFSDASKISSWAGDGVRKAWQSTLMRGNSDGRFNPKGQVTKAEMAALVYNILDRAGKLK